jgi:hypothetical protein
VTRSIISKNTTSEFILTTNIKNPIKILGVAEASIRDSKSDPWRKGYFCFYEESGSTKKAEINQELYSALHLVFETLGDDHEYFFGGDYEKTVCDTDVVNVDDLCLR